VSKLLLCFDEVVDVFVDDGTVFFIFLIENFTVLEMVNQATKTL
jgi:hypothetical protein